MNTHTMDNNDKNTTNIALDNAVEQEIAKKIALSNIKIHNFNKVQPLPTTKTNKISNFISYGKSTNEYLLFLKALYDDIGSSIHTAIISRKAKMIAGNGFEGLDRKNDNMKLIYLAQNLALDYEIYNGFAFEIIYANDGSVNTLNYIPFHKLLKGVKTEIHNEDYYWFSNDWTQSKKDEFKPIAIMSYDPNNIPDEDSNFESNKQIFYYISTETASEIYPKPYYKTSINAIKLHYQMSEYELNQCENGYSFGHILNLPNGNTIEEERYNDEREIKKNFKGTTGETLMITYSETADTAPTLIPIQVNDNFKRFDSLETRYERRIFVAHQVTNPQLFGIPAASGLAAGHNEMNEALQIFQALYIDYRQNDIENAINDVLDTEYKLKKFILPTSSNATLNNTIK